MDFQLILKKNDGKFYYFKKTAEEIDYGFHNRRCSFESPLKWYFVSAIEKKYLKSSMDKIAKKIKLITKDYDASLEK